MILPFSKLEANKDFVFSFFLQIREEGTCVDAAGVARNKLRCDNRRWYASKLLPKKYGEKLGVEHSGEINIGLAETIAEARKRANITK